MMIISAEFFYVLFNTELNNGIRRDDIMKYPLPGHCARYLSDKLLTVRNRYFWL